MHKLILIVEDEPLVRMLAVDTVQDAGFETLEAASADQALLLLEAYPDIKILMTDIDMPGSMNGQRYRLSWSRACNGPKQMSFPSGAPSMASRMTWAR